MFEALKRSWELTKISLQVMKEDKELLLFPILAGIFSLCFIIAMLFPTVIVTLLAGDTVTGDLAFYLILYLVYFGLAIIATFFNVCVVYTAKKRFSGGNATFGESIGFAFSRIGVILAWAALSATVGIILRIIERLGDRLGPVGDMIVHFITGMIGMAWSLITIFVVPSMVYKGVGPVQAIKESAQKFKHTWGENIVAMVGFGAVQTLLIFAGAIVFILLFILAAPLGTAWMIAIIALGLLYVVSIVVFFSLANAVFQTALYEYAQSGKVPSAYPDAFVKDAFAKQD